MSHVAITRTGEQQPRIVLELLGDDDVTGGGAIYSLQERSGRTPITSWEGTEAITWTLPLSLDGFDDNPRSVEREIALLKAWQLPSDKDDKPPVLDVDAPLGRAPATARWVLQDLEWGDQIRNSTGQRVRQDVRVTFLEYQAGAIKKGPAAKSRDNAKTHKWVAISAKDRRCKICKRKRDDKHHSNR